MSSSGIPVIGGAFGVPIVGNVNGVVVSGTPSSGQVLTATSSTAADWQSPSAGTPAFSAITSGTNTGMAGVIGTGASLTVSGSGTNNATAIDGVTVSGTPSVGQVPTATSGSAASWATQTASAVNAIPLPSTMRSWYWQYDQSAGVLSTNNPGFFSCGGLGIGLVPTSSGACNASAAQGSYVTTYNGGSAATVAYMQSASNLGTQTTALKIFYVGNSLQMTCLGCWYNANTADVTVQWLGFTDQTAATMAAGANPAGNYAAFRFVNGTDTHFQCVTKDGTTQTVTDSGVAPSAGFWASTSSNVFQIISNDGVPNVQFYINGTLVATNTTHLPTSGTATAWMNVSKSASAIGVGPNMSWLYITATK